MKYNFDEVIDRSGTSCEKYDKLQEYFGRADAIPMWVADMDFATPDFVMSAIAKRAEHKIMGYSYRDESYHKSIIDWVERRNNWTIDRAWIGFTPGVVVGLILAIKAVTNEGDGIVIQPPIYPPFMKSIKDNNRKIIENPLAMGKNGFEIDFDDLDKKLAQAKAFMMSNPHNPTGRCYTKDELTKIAELCIKHNVTLISDEIHSDLIQKPYKHIHIASLSKEIADLTITFIAPSKTFNLAGLSTSVVIISNTELMAKFRQQEEISHSYIGNIFGAVALEAAYTHGDEWLDQLNEYVGINMDYVVDFINKNLPKIKCFRSEATYMLWLDMRNLGLSDSELKEFLVFDAGLALNPGILFGRQGSGFSRMNVSLPLETVKKAMHQLKEAYDKRGFY